MFKFTHMKALRTYFTHRRRHAKSKRRPLRTSRARERMLDEVDVSEINESSEYEISNDGASDSDSDADEQSDEEAFLSALRENDDLQSYLTTELCGKSESATSTMLSRVANFLSWLDKHVESSPNTDVYFLVNALLTTHFKLLPKYLVHLTSVFVFKAATVSNYIDDIMSFANWFVVFRVTQLTQYPTNFNDVHALSLVAKAMRKVYYKKRKAEFHRSANTIEDLIEMQKWPVNGIADLYQACVDELPWLDRVLAEGTVKNKKTYNRFMQLLCSSAYSSSAQGRVHAIDGLTIRSLPSMLREQAVLSAAFKTNTSFGLQPVTISDLFRHLLHIYMVHFRPQQFGQDPDDYLFISQKNKPVSVGTLVIRFFKRTLGLHITTTRIRSMVETESEQLREDGQISAADRTSILNINGHSGATADKHYVKKSRMGDVDHAQAVFQKLIPAHVDTTFPSDAYASSMQDEIMCDVAVVPAMPLAGSAHPHFASTKQRVPWSKAELDFVGTWCTANSHFSNVVAKCLHAIRKDPNVLPLFHAIHIQDSARLRHGWDTYRKNL